MKTKITKKMVAFGMVMTMLFSMALVANAETTLKDGDSVNGATVAFSHTYSYAKVVSTATMSGYTKNSHIHDAVTITLKNTKTGAITHPSPSGDGIITVTVSYSRPNSTTITYSRSDYTYRNNGSATRTKTLKE